PEHGISLDKLAPHRPPLPAVAGKDEDHFPRPSGGRLPDAQSAARLITQKGVQAFDTSVRGGGDQSQPIIMVRAPQAGRGANSSERGAFGLRLRDQFTEPLGKRSKRLGTARG